MFDASAVIERPARKSIASNDTTSREAGEQIEGDQRTILNERRLLAWLKESGGATDQECQEHFGWDGNYQRPRRHRLVRLKLVRDSGERRKTGRVPCIVWKVV